MDPIPQMPEVTRYFHPVLAAKKLKAKPMRIEVAGHAYVLFRGVDGRPAALVDRCAHRFAPLSQGHVRPDGRLACGYHGWHFNSNGNGCSPSQPSLSKCDVRSLQVIERLDYLWIADKSVPVSEFPEMGWDGFEYAGAFDWLFEAPVHVSLANFSEDEHFPYVHTRLGWDDRTLDEIDFEADNFDDRSEVRYRGTQRSSRYVRFLLVKPGDIFYNEWVTRFDPLRALFSFKWQDRKTREPRPLKLKIMIFITPETVKTTRFHVFLFLKLDAPRLRFLLPLAAKAAMLMGKKEVQDDADFARHLADTPYDMKGMRLGKFDKPVIHNNRLLRAIYLAGSVRDSHPVAEETPTNAKKAEPPAVAGGS
jgi:phenylpropionate dioxygenase-like ring-hydroxylating dioxygenase large terminal subunit